VPDQLNDAICLSTSVKLKMSSG